MKLSLIDDEIYRIGNIQKHITNFLNDDNYIFADDVDKFFEENRLELMPFRFTLNLFAVFRYFEYKSDYININNELENLANKIDEHNEKYLNNRRKLFKELCGKVEGRELDEEQIDAIIREDRNQLVIAGAGCGKTTTIVGKVKFLVKTLKVKPEDILLLSFTKKSAKDMKERVEQEIGTNMECYTFHKLGLEITKQELSDPKIYDGNMQGFIKEQIKKLIQNEDYLNILIYFLTENIHLIKDEFTIKSEEEYKKYIEINPPTTIKGEIVKSYGEMEIANYLFSNSINYEYEAKYKYDTDTSEYGEYHPDFYLPDYDIYIEYFGIDRNGNVPSYYTSRHGKTPKEEYNDGIKWKKELHANNNTTLIDLYYYENKEGELKTILENKLSEIGVKLNPLTTNDIFRYIENKNRGLIDGIASSFETIINLIKSNDYKFDNLREMAKATDFYDNIAVTLDLIEPIYDEYDIYLTENKMIDFNDMINLATSIISSGNYVNKYKYVIVDEFQDISNSRYQLLKALRDSSNYKLYCVGDDFQSIYRFSGSDIGIFTNFKNYFGPVHVSKIERTHRFSDTLSKISGKFIMQNTNQIKKNLYGYKDNVFPISEIVAYNSKYALTFLEEKLNLLEKNSSVLFLGRYNFDVDLLKENENFNYAYDRENNTYRVVYKKRQDLNIEFMSVHKSKGLQSDYVVILNNRKRGMGFPSRMLELPIMQLLLDNSDDYPYSEERRLFYVALTRARKKVFLLVEKNNKSVFINELESDYKRKLIKIRYECPICGEDLVIIDGKYGNFLGCSNYPNCTYTKKL